MVHARVARLVYGTLEPKAGAIESAMRAHEHPSLNHRIEATGGVLEAECREVMQAFFADRRLESGVRRQEWTIPVTQERVMRHSQLQTIGRRRRRARNRGNAHVHLQDGDLVVYNSNTVPVFTTNTGLNPGAYLVCQNDGNIVIYNSGGAVLWATGIP